MADGAGHRYLTRCGFDLVSTVTPHLGRRHPILQAQNIIRDIVSRGTANLATYGNNGQPALHALADIWLRATYLLSTETSAALTRVTGLEDVGASYDVSRAQIESAPRHAHPAHGWATSTRAAITAVGLTAALDALDKQATHRPTRLPRSRQIPEDAQLAVLGPVISAGDELRHRTPPSTSRCNPAYLKRIDDLTRRTPSMLWPAWALRFAIPYLGQRYLRPALSALLLLVDSPMRVSDATDLLRSPIKDTAVLRVLSLLSSRTDWPDIRTALGRLADYLADNDTPIDYERRRQLDYTGLLPQQVWVRICRDTSSPAPGLRQTRIARCYLYERLSGLPIDSAGTGEVDHALRTRLADYPLRLTLERASAAEEHCREFLADNNISDEPPFWSPPTSMLQGLRLPGPDPTRVEIPALHSLFENGNGVPGRVATKLDTTVDVVRFLAERNPVPIRPPATLAQARARGYTRLTAKAALPPSEFRKMYHDEQLSLDEMALRVGVCKQIITRIAREYDIPLRPGGAPTRHHVEKAWLYQRYITERRTFSEIADESGTSEAIIRRWAHKYGIPVRSRGSANRRADLDALLDAERAPKILRPALTGIGGWDRLLRFAGATEYPTLTIAARQLRARTLVQQKLRLEADLGFQLFERAQRGQPMRLTKGGRKVLAAIRAMQATNHPPGGSDPSPQGPPSGRKAPRKAHRQMPDR